MFVEAVKQVVVANKDYIPPEGKARLWKCRMTSRC